MGLGHGYYLMEVATSYGPTQIASWAAGRKKNVWFIVALRSEWGRWGQASGKWGWAWR